MKRAQTKYGDGMNVASLVLQQHGVKQFDKQKLEAFENRVARPRRRGQL